MQDDLLTKEVQTLSHLLREGAAYLKNKDIPASELESEMLLSNLLSLRRIDLYLHPEKRVSPEQCLRFLENLERRAEHMPLQYITGHVEFCGLLLVTRPGVFIPRPETELIVEEAKKLFPEPKQILDLCTGSGALAIALAKQFPASRVWASDISDAALSLAADNITGHQLDAQITLLKGDLLEALKSDASVIAPFDLIVCNPPYIAEKDGPDLPPEVRDYEPEIALFAPDEGRSFYPRILLDVPRITSDHAVLLFELGAGLSPWFKVFVEENTNFEVSFIRDWAKIDRIARVSKPERCDG